MEVLNTILEAIIAIAFLCILIFLFLTMPSYINYINSVTLKQFKYAEIDGKTYSIKNIYDAGKLYNIDFVIFEDNKEKSNTKILIHKSKVTLYTNMDFKAEKWYQEKIEEEKNENHN